MSGSVEKKVARFIKIIQNDDEFVLQSDAQYLKFKTIKFKPAYYSEIDQLARELYDFKFSEECIYWLKIMLKSVHD